jgi:zinc transport system substrate-binding protein
MIRKVLALTLFALVVAAGIYAVTQLAPNTRSSSNGRVAVTASFYPMGEFARQVGGDRADVKILVKPGVEPHDYDPSPQDIVAVHRSKLLVYNGAGIEPWADKLAGELGGQGTTVVEAAAGINDGDPHVWLDPVRAMSEVEAIKDGFIKADLAGEAVYEANAQAYQAKLAALNQEYAAGLANCRLHDIITSHAAFSYLAQRYHFQAHGLAGLSPDAEPSPQKLAEAAALVRSHNLKYIFFESLASPKLANTLAKETGATPLEFNPLEGLTGQEADSGQDYLSVMRHNLENLRIALDCN